MTDPINVQSMIQGNYERHGELDLNGHDYEQMYKSLVSFIKEEIWYHGIVDDIGMSVDELRKSEPTILIKLLVEAVQNQNSDR
ncbi:MAG: hypothetical protein VKL42_08875 [Snowella sp.]|nr:hypothetical protein [Snowella sp.]